MIETVINKVFRTKEELEKYEEYLREKYILFMVIHKDNTIGEPTIYGIDKIIHFGERS